MRLSKHACPCATTKLIKLEHHRLM